jgi:hypothetical protein
MEELEAMHTAYMESSGKTHANIFSSRRRNYKQPQLIFLDEISMIGTSLLDCLAFVLQ